MMRELYVKTKRFPEFVCALGQCMSVWPVKLDAVGQVKLFVQTDK